MDEEHKDRIEEDYMYLSVCMRQNIKRLVKYLVEKKTINNEQEEDILDEASDTLKSQTLLDYLLAKDEAAFTNFYEGCLYSHMWKAADILMPENGPHQPREEEIEEFLPENWPTESHFDVIKDPQTLRIKKVGPRHTQMMGYFEASAKSETADNYDMSNKVKGRVLIINNEKFDHHPRRSGSDYDRAGLDYVFSQLSFEIRVEANLTAEKMLEIMEDEATKKDHSLSNCFVIAILSYGYGERYVLGTDAPKVLSGTDPENCVELERIKEIFAKVPHLVTKPKVFLIEAEPLKPGQFREPGPREKKPPSDSSSDPSSSTLKSDNDGVDSDYGLNFSDSVYSSSNVPKLEIGKSISMMKTLSDGLFDGLDDKTEADGPLPSSAGGKKTAPLGADIFIATANFKDRLMHQQIPYGSWFIQAFIYVVANYAHQNDLQILIQKINDLMMQQKRVNSVKICSSKSTLNKKLYFFPGLPLEG